MVLVLYFVIAINIGNMWTFSCFEFLFPFVHRFVRLYISKLNFFPNLTFEDS